MLNLGNLLASLARSSLCVIQNFQRERDALLLITQLVFPRRLIADNMNPLWEHIITIAMILCKYNHADSLNKQLGDSLRFVLLC